MGSVYQNSPVLPIELSMAINNLQGMRDSAREVLKEMAGLSEIDITDLLAGANEGMIDYAVKSVTEIHKRYWKNLQ